MKLLSVLPLSLFFTSLYIASDTIIPLQVDDLCKHISIELDSAVHAQILTPKEADTIMTRCTNIYGSNY